MRSRRPLVSALLAVAVLAGQWLCAIHESDHDLQAAAQSCAVCAYAHGAGAGALPATPQLALDVDTEAPATPLAARALAATVRNHPIRGPPASLA